MRPTTEKIPSRYLIAWRFFEFDGWDNVLGG